MLTAAQQELITAAVDGELSAPEARAFKQLIETSAEARKLHTKLQADSARVRALTQVTPPADLHAKILTRIAASTPAPVRKPARHAKHATEPAKPARPAFAEEPTHSRVPARVPVWVPAVVAAGLLVCVTAGSFAFFNSRNSQHQIAKNPWGNVLPAPQDLPTAVPSPTATTPRPDPDAVARIDVSPVPPLPMPKAVAPHAVAIAPTPRPVQYDLHASGILPPLPPLEFIEVRVPFLRTVAELNRDDIRQELLDELAHDRDTAFRFDVFVRDAARGVEVFQHAAKVSGLSVFADAGTLDKLKKKQVASVVIYTESLTPAELAELFSKLSTEDAKFSPRVCDSLHAMPAASKDESELKAILGVDAGLFRRPAGSGGGGTGLPKPSDKPVSAGTIDSVTKTLTSPPAKQADKPAMLMAWQTHMGTARTVPSASAELKQFLAKRGDRKPNAIPAIIVIRPVG